MAFVRRICRLSMLVACSLCAASAFAQQAAPPTDQHPDEEETPTPAPLTVGSMAIASDAALAVEAMDVDVAVDHVTYAYRLHNQGQARLSLAASVAFPDLELNNEGTTVYLLPSQIAENVVGLAVQSNGAPVQTTPSVQAVALGIDRLGALKADAMPLIPFGDAIDKALAAAKPEILLHLESLGLVTPRDPSEPDTPVIADWSLHVVHAWTQTLEPNAVTSVTVSFAPIKAVYTIEAASLGGFDALKQQICLTPEIMDSAKALLAAPGATADVADITLANDGPARWLDNPAATVTVHKPTPDSVVAFCGMDTATSGQAVVKGKMPGSSEAPGLRVLIFTKGSKK